MPSYGPGDTNVQGMNVMKRKQLPYLALAGFFALATGASAETVDKNKVQAPAGGGKASVQTQGSGKASVQTQGGGNLRGNAMQSQNRMTLRNYQGANRNQHVDRHLSSRNATINRNYSNRHVDIDRNRKLNHNRTVLHDQKLRNRSVGRTDRDRTVVGANPPKGQQATAQISQSQRLRIRQVFEHDRRHFHHVARVGFPIFVGSAVPRDYAIYDVPEDIVEYMPEYQGYKYIVVGDELLIIDPVTLEIVAIIPV
jgi:Protein of unknown function (DUF1236)